MRKQIILMILTVLLPLTAMAQYEEDTDNGVVSLAGR